TPSRPRGPVRSNWAYAPLLHFDFGAAAQAVAHAVDHLGAGPEPLPDRHGRTHFPAHDDRHLHGPTPFHHVHHAAATALGHRRPRHHAHRQRAHLHARRAG